MALPKTDFPWIYSSFIHILASTTFLIGKWCELSHFHLNFLKNSGVICNGWFFFQHYLASKSKKAEAASRIRKLSQLCLIYVLFPELNVLSKILKILVRFWKGFVPIHTTRKNGERNIASSYFMRMLHLSSRMLNVFISKVQSASCIFYGVCYLYFYTINGLQFKWCYPMLQRHWG